MTLTRGQIFEIGFWAVFALAAFALTFEFNQDLDIYEFGAYGWPRAVIFLIALTLAGQIYHDIRFKGAVGNAMEADEPPEAVPPAERNAYLVRMVLTLGMPLAFGLLLQPVGFYVLTPFFICGFLYVAGERRLPWLVGVSAFIYAFLVFVFVKVFYVGLPVGTIGVFYDMSNAILGLIR